MNSATKCSTYLAMGCLWVWKFGWNSHSCHATLDFEITKIHNSEKFTSWTGSFSSQTRISNFPRTGRIFLSFHYSDDTMSAMASQITGVSVVCSGADQRKHQISASTGLCVCMCACMCVRGWGAPVTGGFPSQRASYAENIWFSTFQNHVTGLYEQQETSLSR